MSFDETHIRHIMFFAFDHHGNASEAARNYASPPKSPDVAPSDYHLFQSLRHFLKGKKFQNKHQVEKDILLKSLTNLIVNG